MPLPLLALAAPAIIKGVAGFFGGRARAKAQEEAAKIQSAAADRVAGINRGVYQQQMSGMEPYAALGRSGANTLGRLMTPGIPYSREMQLADARRQQSALPPWAMDPGEAQNAADKPPPKVSAFARPFVEAAARQNQGQLGELAQAMVAMRSPSGDVRRVPASRVEELMRKGAVRV